MTDQSSQSSTMRRELGWWTLIAFVAVLGGINFWGIRQSSTVNIVCTVVEAAGLLTVIVVGLAFLSKEQAAPPAQAIAVPIAWWGVLQGSALAFFAFIGFEDIANCRTKHVPSTNYSFASSPSSSLMPQLLSFRCSVRTEMPSDLAACVRLPS